MTTIFRALCVVAALATALAYYIDDPKAAGKNFGQMKEQAEALSERGPEFAEELGAKVKDVKKSASGAKSRLDSIRDRVEDSMEKSRDRVEKHF